TGGNKTWQHNSKDYGKSVNLSAKTTGSSGGVKPFNSANVGNQGGQHFKKFDHKDGGGNGKPPTNQISQGTKTVSTQQQGIAALNNHNGDTHKFRSNTGNGPPKPNVQRLTNNQTIRSTPNFRATTGYKPPPPRVQYKKP